MPAIHQEVGSTIGVGRPPPGGAVMDVGPMSYPDRRFQMWAYSVGMGRLLLRSTKSDTFPTRVDVLFQDVSSMNMRTSLDGLVVERASRLQAEKISMETGVLASDSQTAFAVYSGQFRGYVMAGVCAHVEDDGEYFDPSELWPTRS